MKSQRWRSLACLVREQGIENETRHNTKQTGKSGNATYEFQTLWLQSNPQNSRLQTQTHPEPMMPVKRKLIQKVYDTRPDTTTSSPSGSQRQIKTRHQSLSSQLLSKSLGTRQPNYTKSTHSIHRGHSNYLPAKGGHSRTHTYSISRSMPPEHQSLVTRKTGREDKTSRAPAHQRTTKPTAIFLNMMGVKP